MDVIFLKLNQLGIGDKAIISYIAESDLTRRLKDIGILKGNAIECVYESPFSDPRVYLIKGAFFSIRNCDASTVIVEVI